MSDASDRASWPVRKGCLHDPPPKRERPSPAECIAMMQQLADDAWAFKGSSDAETRLSSRIIRVVRRPG